ncbi:hypothetical protein QPK87_13460 [Kamptonema cortianum]|nr:hypothetical protein [Kamptonema cortianum]
MSKSKGNYFTPRDLFEKGFDPLALRLALLAVPYNKPHNFTLQGLKDAEGHIERFRECTRRIEVAGDIQAREASGDLGKIYDEMLGAMLNDLNTSVAIAKALEGVKVILKQPQLSSEIAAEAKWFLQKTNQLLGIVSHDYPDDCDKPADVETLVDGQSVEFWIQERQAAKMAKDFSTADEIRNKLVAAGIELRDAPEGTTWIKR